jgi:hypothetical protein
MWDEAKLEAADYALCGLVAWASHPPSYSNLDNS